MVQYTKSSMWLHRCMVWALSMVHWAAETMVFNPSGSRQEHRVPSCIQVSQQLVRLMPWGESWMWSCPGPEARATCLLYSSKVIIFLRLANSGSTNAHIWTTGHCWHTEHGLLKRWWSWLSQLCTECTIVAKDRTLWDIECNRYLSDLFELMVSINVHHFRKELHHFSGFPFTE